MALFNAPTVKPLPNLRTTHAGQNSTTNSTSEARPRTSIRGNSGHHQTRKTFNKPGDERECGHQSQQRTLKRKSEQQPQKPGRRQEAKRSNRTKSTWPNSTSRRKEACPWSSALHTQEDGHNHCTKFAKPRTNSQGGCRQTKQKRASSETSKQPSSQPRQKRSRPPKQQNCRQQQQGGSQQARTNQAGSRTSTQHPNSSLMMCPDDVSAKRMENSQLPAFPFPLVVCL